MQVRAPCSFDKLDACLHSAMERRDYSSVWLLVPVVFKQVVSISLINLSGCAMAGCAFVDLGEKVSWVRSDWVHTSGKLY